MAGVLVRLRLERDFTPGAGVQMWDTRDMFPRAQTGAEGQFRFNQLAAGKWSAEANHRDESAKVEAIELATGDQQEIELVLGTPDQLTVIVTTAPGEPVADAVIRVQSEGESRLGGYGRTDGTGTVRVDITPGPASSASNMRSFGTTRARRNSRRAPTNSGSNFIPAWRLAARFGPTMALPCLWQPSRPSPTSPSTPSSTERTRSRTTTVRSASQASNPAVTTSPRGHPATPTAVRPNRSRSPTPPSRASRSCWNQGSRSSASSPG